MMSIFEKSDKIEPEHPELSVSHQCTLLNLCRSSYYRGSINDHSESAENLKIMRIIDEEYMRHPFYGSRKMSDYLDSKGEPSNRKRVQRLMRIMGIQSVAPKPNTSKPRKEHKIYPYLLKNIDINAPNQAWCSDITYIPLSGGFVYLTAIMDWHSRFVLSWEVSITMDDDFCVNALQSALRRFGRPDIFNTDQGSQYTGNDFTGVLKKHDIRISMDGKGRAMDNIFIERLWRSVKYEEIYIKDYSSVLELKEELKKYFEFYNFERFHYSLEKKTPAEVYWGKTKLQMAA